MFLLTLAIANANADVAFGAEECAIATLSQSIPAAGATDVPVDIAPLLVMSGNCGVADPYVLRVFEDGATTPLVETEYGFAAFDSVGENFILEADFGTLSPNTGYTVHFDSEWGEQRQFAFSTGSGTVEAISGVAPQITVDYAAQSRIYRGWHTVEVEVTLATAGDGTGAYIVREGGVDRGVFVAGGANTTQSLFWGTDAPPRQVCLTAVERDGTGAWHGPSEESCLKVQGTRGCSHTAPWLAGWMLLLPLLARRKSS